MKYTQMKSDLTQYSSPEEMLEAWQHTKEFHMLPEKARVASLAYAREQYTIAMDDKAQREQEAASGPDATGRLNERIGQFVDRYAGRDTGIVARALLPSSNAQAAIDAATLFIPGLGEIAPIAKAVELAPEAMAPLARLGLRLAKPAIAGLVGGATSGHAGEGAVSGLAQGGVGEGISLLGGIGKRAINRYDLGRLSKWLEPRIGQKLSNASDYYTAFKGGKVAQAAQTAYDAANASVGKVVAHRPMFTFELSPEQADAIYYSGDKTLQSMGLRPGKNVVDFEFATKILHKLDQLGWDYNGNPTTKATGKALRGVTHQIEGEIASQLDAINPKAASAWYTARGKYRLANTLTNMFNEPGVIDNGYVDMSKLQTEASSNYVHDLQQALGMGDTPAKVQATGEKARQGLSKVLHRGADEGRQDIVGHAPGGHVYGHTRGLSGFFSMPKLSRHVGYLPADLGKGKAITAAATLGPYRFVRGVENYMNIDPSATLPQGSEAPPPAGISVVPGSVTAEGKPAPELTPNITPAPAATH